MNQWRGMNCDQMRIWDKYASTFPLLSIKDLFIATQQLFENLSEINQWSLAWFLLGTKSITTFDPAVSVE